MDALRNKARELLENKLAQVVIGYGEGSLGRVRPVFVKEPAAAVKLVYDGRCLQNLATYLLKPEVKKMGKIALVAKPAALKTVLQLAAENQIVNGEIIVLGVTADGKLIDFPDFKAIEAHVAASGPDLSPEELAVLDRLSHMSVEERWAYWQEQLSRCFKCYACRAACPLCYCTRCTVECNQPQWIPVPAHDLGNLEWHVMRAMHLAGRCVNCGDCGRACPLDIPLNLLTQMLVKGVGEHFGQRAGISATLDHALSTFKPNDKENFIG